MTQPDYRLVTVTAVPDWIVLYEALSYPWPQNMQVPVNPKRLLNGISHASCNTSLGVLCCHWTFTTPAFTQQASWNDEKVIGIPKFSTSCISYTRI